MLWLVLFLLLLALGVLWWRFAMPAPPGAAMTPSVLKGNHPCLRTRHYRLADFYPAPVVVPPDDDLVPEQEPPASSPGAVPAANPALDAMELKPPAPEAGQLPEGALHNYLTAPAPTANDAHNRGVELTAAERRAKMRALMSTALENRRAAPASA